MRYWDAVYAFLAALAVAVVLTPFVGRLARRIGAVDLPRERGLAVKETPLLGGLAILAGFLVAALIWMPATLKLPAVPHAGPHSGGAVHMWGVIGGACWIAVVGVVDDIWELRPLIKFLGQIIAAVVVVEAGVVVTDVTLPFIGGLQFPNAGGALTVIGLVFLMNVVNLSDGVDGLAAGLCTIDAVALAIIAFDLQGGGSAAGVLAAITAGAALGFLFHNFPPAKIFMGDTGANLLGYLLGVVAVIGSVKTNVVLALVVPLFILAVPFLDTGFVVAKRLKYRRKPWAADRNHFHHRMANLGFSQRKTVAYLYGWTLMLAGVALALRFVPYSDHHGHFRAEWLTVMAVIALAAFAASVYLVYVLEILKFKRWRTMQIRRADPDTSEHEIDERVRRDVETGEFDHVGPEAGEFDHVGTEAGEFDHVGTEAGEFDHVGTEAGEFDHVGTEAGEVDRMGSEAGGVDGVGSSPRAEVEPEGPAVIHDARRVDDSRARGARLDGGAPPEPRRGERAAGRRDR